MQKLKVTMNLHHSQMLGPRVLTLFQWVSEPPPWSSLELALPTVHMSHTCSSESVTQSSGKPYNCINVRLSHNHKLQADKKLGGVLLLSNQLLAKIVKHFSWVFSLNSWKKKKL